MTMERIIQSTIETVLVEKFSNTENQIENLVLQVSTLEKTLKELLKKSNPEEKLTVQEAALLLKVKNNTVRDYCKKDKLDYEKLGGQYRITRSAITNYLNKN